MNQEPLEDHDFKEKHTVHSIRSKRRGKTFCQLIQFNGNLTVHFRNRGKLLVFFVLYLALFKS